MYFKRADVNTNRLLDHHADKDTASLSYAFFISIPFLFLINFLHLRNWFRALCGMLWCGIDVAKSVVDVTCWLI